MPKIHYFWKELENKFVSVSHTIPQEETASKALLRAWSDCTGIWAHQMSFWISSGNKNKTFTYFEKQKLKNSSLK